MAINLSDLPPKYQVQAMEKYMKQQTRRGRMPSAPSAGSRWRGYGENGCFRFSQIRRTQTTLVASAPSVGVSKLRLQGIGFALLAALP